MTYYMKRGNSFSLAKDKEVEVYTELPAGNYFIKVTPFGEFYLETTDSFEPLKKYYGDCLKNCDRVLNTFNDRKNSTGILLSGNKGSGKTLLARELSIRAAERHAIPTIIISSPFYGDKFNEFITTISQPCVVMFDEFEKVYDKDQQDAILTLLDGTFQSKKLFIFTCNDVWQINTYMMNRPGRIFYALEYKGLTEEFIREYCDDNLENKSYTDQVVLVSTLLRDFNFDMLKALIEDMNRYNESPKEVLAILNAKPDQKTAVDYTLKFLENGVPIEKLEAGYDHCSINLMGNYRFYVEYYHPTEKEDDGDPSYYAYAFNQDNMVEYDVRTQNCVFKKEEDGKELICLLSKAPVKEARSYLDLF